MPEITFIGTGSAIPSAMRNASSILVKNNDHYIIMDSGENALFNIFNVFGSNKGHEILTKLEFIFISHAHMDHFVGLFSLINYWSEANSNNPSKKLNIVCHEYISQLVNFFTSKWNCKQTEKCKFITSKEKTIDVNKMAIINEFGLDGISFCKTIHINSSIGLRLDFKSGFSLSYSGDTRYCRDFVKLSKHVDLMIHEATFENKLADPAKITNHSTNEDALHATINSECKFALLTHFSQRYDKCPRINNKVDGKEISNFGIAYDNLFVNERNISSLGKFYCLVKKALENHGDEMMQEKISRFSQ
ncbi:MAG: Zinc phosphodiesterase ELAC protein 2, partial [Paramarteilia canceri]